MKKWKLLAAAAVLAFVLPGCTSQSASSPTPAAVSSEADKPAETGNSGETEQETKAQGQNFSQEALCEWEKGSIRLNLPEEAVYTVEEDTASDSAFGIRFRMDAQMDGEVFVEYDEHFAVCGTGLEETEIRINDMPARMGVYDNAPYWSFLVLTGEYQGYVVTAEGMDSWWEDYGEAVMQVLETLTIFVE